MKQLALSPDQVIVPFELLVGEERMLRLYFRIMRARAEELLPPVLVARPRLSDREFILERSVSVPDAQRFFAKIDRLVEERGAVYLIDGNHRGVAATLCHRPLTAFDVEDDRDLRRIETMGKNGEYLELPPFPTDYFEAGWIRGELRSIVTRLEEREEGSEVLTLEDRTRRLVEQRLVPDYMIRWYRSQRRDAGA